MHIKNTVEKFTKIGGQFLGSPESLATSIKTAKAIIFDWDGVFNDGQKGDNGSSNFNEVDSMGINLLRFSYWLNYKKTPLTAVLSGERNLVSFYWTKREHFTSCYYKQANKTQALEHFCNTNNIKPAEIIFVFDDVLDLSVAKLVGTRIFISRKANPLFNDYVVKYKLADYITANEPNHYAIRETCELLIGMQDIYEKVITERVTYSTNYKNYIDNRNSLSTTFFTTQNNTIVELEPTT